MLCEVVSIFFSHGKPWGGERGWEAAGGEHQEEEKKENKEDEEEYENE